ncbi:RNA 2'-phosphotransferase [Planomicrobium sp. CPCC 101110]|uniref:RNA 2'-phosphotransferase n=1 Tax=Planomicrobium sp. CPCC 101110 TaxID=2599619 RepID=UPI0011B7E39A|nr:RNA 2'-phosphotransferase [Planomicrobium sp. CPCC 101110]TWT26017.1 RNA 2'-phosphotransferase [Planomicrobium sp. CPCC 101110]
MSRHNDVRLSSFMAKILRHSPEKFGLKLDDYGYCGISELAKVIQAQPQWRQITEEDIRHIAAASPKQRYLIKGSQIKARYGHSIPVQQETSAKQVPPFLYHGTYREALEAIKKAGILPMGRQQVHLSESPSFATLAARRRKNPLLLKIDTYSAMQAGAIFRFAGNEVWLSTSLPPSSIIEEIPLK